jgi:hypothetical protein
VKTSEPDSSAVRTGSVKNTESVETTKLPAQIFRASHPKHGELEIIQHEKTDNKIQFTLTLRQTNNRQNSIIDVEMETSKSARNYKGKSSVGYNYIDLDDLQGKSIGYVLHCVACKLATQLGADLLVIDDVVEPAMRAMCQKVNMKPLFDESYSIEPSTGESSFRHKAIDKGWVVEF